MVGNRVVGGEWLGNAGDGMLNPNAAIEGRRPGSIPALGNAQGRLSPAMKGLKARHQIVRKPDSRWIGPSALVVFLLPNLGRRSCLALAQAVIEPGLRPSIAAFGLWRIQHWNLRR